MFFSTFKLQGSRGGFAEIDDEVAAVLAFVIFLLTFLAAQDDDTRGRKGSHLGDMLRVLELAVLYYDTSSP